MEREHLIMALREALKASEPDLAHPIIEQKQSYRYLGRKSVLMLCTALSICFTIGLYFFLDYKLGEMIKPLIQ